MGKGKSVGDVQDVALHHINKELKRDEYRKKNSKDNYIKRDSLEEMLAFERMSPEDKQRTKHPRDWSRDLNDYCRTVKGGPHAGLVNYVTYKYKKELQEFHEKGSPYKEVVKFIESKQLEYMNL